MEGIKHDGSSTGTSEEADGPAQGSIVDDGNGNWWGFVFRDSGPAGRLPWLVPITWTDGWEKLGGVLEMTYSISNHFMGYRFALYNFAKTSEGGYADFDFFRVSDTITAQ